MEKNTSAKILLLEDDPGLIDGLSYALNRNGFHIDVASSVSEAFQRLNNSVYHLLILDITLPDGTGYEVCEKIRKSGSAGTHNGMKNIIEHIKTTDFPRVRVGIGCEADIELYNYVLSAFSKDEAVLIEKSIKRVSDILDEIIQNGVDKAMNMFNGIK